MNRDSSKISNPSGGASHGTCALSAQPVADGCRFRLFLEVGGWNLSADEHGVRLIFGFPLGACFGEGKGKADRARAYSGQAWDGYVNITSHSFFLAAPPCFQVSRTHVIGTGRRIRRFRVLLDDYNQFPGWTHSGLMKFGVVHALQ